MAVARFQIVSSPGARQGFIWRFLSANNRSMAMSSVSYPDAESCLAAINRLQEQLESAVGVTTQDGSGLWLWRVRSAEAELAESARRYQRKVRARLACESFLVLARAITPAGTVQVVRF